MRKTTCNPPFLATGFRVVVLVAFFVLSACGGEPRIPESTAGAIGSGPAAIVASPEGRDGDIAASGEMRLQLGRDMPLVLPVTYCAGQEAIYTAVARQGESQIDLRVLEHPTMRGDKPLEAVTEVSLQRSGSEDGRTYQEIWTSKTVSSVERNGQATRVSGQMQGIRMYANGDGTFTSPVPIDQDEPRAFDLASECRAG